jgi:hypothetical protein
MTVEHPTGEAPATPEYVLEVFREWHRIEVAAGEARDIPISFETAFWDWIDSKEVDDWGRAGFGGAMNRAWKIEIAAQRWREFERTASTLGELCHLIASVAKRPMLRPWHHIEGECWPAGAFLTLRSLLAGAGVDPERLTPSASLKPYLTRRYDSLWLAIVRLRPGCGPVPYFTSGERFARTTLMVVFGLSLFAMCMLPILAIPVLILSWIGLFILAQFAGSWQFHDPAIHTFRDLAYTLAGQQPRRQPFSSPVHDNRGGFVPGTQE